VSACSEGVTEGRAGLQGRGDEGVRQEHRRTSLSQGTRTIAVHRQVTDNRRPAHPHTRRFTTLFAPAELSIAAETERERLDFRGHQWRSKAFSLAFPRLSFLVANSSLHPNGLLLK